MIDAATPELVHSADDRGIAVVTLDSPRNRNALSLALVEQLRERLDRAVADDAIRAVLLTAVGKAFCAGADLSEASTRSMRDATLQVAGVLRAIVEAPKPVVVELAAPVRAGGTGIVAAADIVLASDQVDFAFTEARMGLAPAVISIPLLARVEPRALGRYFLTAETFDAAEAARIGLVTEVVPAVELDAATERVLDGLRRSSAQGLRETKGLLTRRLLADFDARTEPVAELSARLFASDEAMAAMAAFLQRR